MQLPKTMRTELLDELEEFLHASSPSTEALAAYVIEILEQMADDRGIDDLIATLEEAGALDTSLQDTLEQEMNSNDEFEYTGEEILLLLERSSDIDWVDDDDEEDLGDEEDEDDDDEDDEDDEAVEEEDED